jgi:hypothetical protein
MSVSKGLLDTGKLFLKKICDVFTISLNVPLLAEEHADVLFFLRELLGITVNVLCVVSYFAYSLVGGSS